MTVHILPHINASLNALNAILVITGYRLIRRRHVATHKAVMLSAVGVSTVFLTCYLIYHAHVGSVKFTGPSIIRAIYLTILASHTLLAAILPVLIGRTVYLALKNRLPQHRRIARWTLPIWLYVSVTGVVVYLMLYQLYDSK